jgi:hypothetical protein
MRETLFGDSPFEQVLKEGTSLAEFPWNLFAAARSNLLAGNQVEAIACWREIFQHSELEPRLKLQAWHFLRQHGASPPPAIAKQVLGVVAELPMPQGLDLVAAYSDYTARYWNHSGSGVVWEHPNSSLDPQIDQVLAAAQPVVARIGPWEMVRPAPPPNGQIRLSILTPSGLHFGQGPTEVLSRDPLGGRLFQSVITLMRALMQKAKT